MEVFKILLPILTTLLGAGLSLLAIEYRSAREHARKLEKETANNKKLAVAATAEVLLLAVSGQISGKLAKKKVIEIYASNFMTLENGFYKKTIECFDDTEQVLPLPVEQWIASNR